MYTYLQTGITALFSAARNGNLETVQSLITANALLDIQNEVCVHELLFALNSYDSISWSFMRFLLVYIYVPYYFSWLLLIAANLCENKSRMNTKRGHNLITHGDKIIHQTIPTIVNTTQKQKAKHRTNVN